MKIKTHSEETDKIKSMQQEYMKYTQENFKTIFSIEDIKDYLSRGGEINALDQSGQSLFLKAVSNIPMFDFLLENGIDANIKNCYGESALHLSRRAYMVKKLIEAGCSIYDKDDFRDYPISKNLKDKEIFSLYVDAGFDINSKDFWIFEYALSAEVLKLAIKKGLELNRKDKLNPINFISHLDLAQCYVKHNKESLAKQGLVENIYIFEEELKKGKISDNIFDLYLSAGLDPINWLRMNLSLHKMQSVNKYFPEEIYELDEYGNNLLMYYLDSDMIVFDFLLSKGVDINHKNKENKSVLQLMHHWEGAISLIERGAFIYEDWHNYENSMLAEELKIFKSQQEKKILTNTINVNSFRHNKRL